MIKINNPYDLKEINSYLHTANKQDIIELYNKYKDEWINNGVLTYYAEDFIKYQHSSKLEDTEEPFVLYLIYNALNNI